MSYFEKFDIALNGFIEAVGKMFDNGNQTIKPEKVAKAPKTRKIQKIKLDISAIKDALQKEREKHLKDKVD